MDLPRVVHAPTVIADGVMTQHQIKTRYVRLHPGIWVLRGTEPDALLRAEAAWAWGRGTVILAGISAAAVHGARYLPPHAAIITPDHRRIPVGITGKRYKSRPPEVCRRRGMTVTTPERTAYDLARWHNESDAVEMIDALYQTRCLTRARLSAYQPSGRLAAVLALTDEGAESIWETRTRLFIVRGGLPRPESQVKIYDRHGELIGRFDLVYRARKLIIEYDGDQHFEPEQRRKDIVRWNALSDNGWTVIRVKAAQLRYRPELLLGQIRRALGL